MFRNLLRTIVYALVLLAACLTMVANARADIQTDTKIAGERPIPITNTDLGSGR